MSRCVLTSASSVMYWLYTLLRRLEQKVVQIKLRDLGPMMAIWQHRALL